MSEIRLVKLTLNNFKGIKTLTLDLDGCSASIYGANATGKTTIYDAFLWLLFDKDSQNKTNFNIKTLDADGNALHGLDHEVEAVLAVSGKNLTLKKTYKEKWTKRRGSAQAEFTGHTTDYYIDGVPAKKGEYDARIAGLVREDAFRLLTSPTHFSEQLHWQERREILLEIAGDISDDDVIASDKALTSLPGILKGKTIDDLQKIITAKRRQINKELEELPTRIDEVMRGLPDVSGVGLEGLEQGLKDADKAIKAKQAEIAKLKAGGAVSAKAKELDALESEILGIKAEAHRKVESELDAMRQELAPVRMELTDCKSEIEQAKKQASDLEQDAKHVEAELPRLREQWQEISERRWDGSKTCPACGQSLPAEKIKDAVDAFNRQRAEELERIAAEGKRLSQRQTEIDKALEACQKRIDELKGGLKRLEKQETVLLDAIEDMQSASGDSPGLAEKLKQRETLIGEIESIKAGGSDAAQKAEEELKALEVARQGLQVEQVLLERHEQSQKRIDELKAEERVLAEEYEDLERQLYLCETFIRTKVGMLEDKINSRFEVARFKLFNVLVNGALEECCETVFQGVPYADMNNAARLNVGLDIIRTLSKHYRFSAPIFVDNAEAVVSLLPINSQVIRLVVSGEDKTLRIEKEAS